MSCKYGKALDIRKVRRNWLGVRRRPEDRVF